jgi:hypothetical protein
VVKNNHTARFYHVIGAFTLLDFTKSWEQSHSWILPRHGSNHTAGFYHLMGAITAGVYHVMGAITQLDSTTRHGSNHTAGFYYVMTADVVKSSCVIAPMTW